MNSCRFGSKNKDEEIESQISVPNILQISADEESSEIKIEKEKQKAKPELKKDRMTKI